MRKKTVHVSVVIPTFNRADLAARAAESAARQVLPPGKYFEVLVVDDGGSDGTAGRVASQAVPSRSAAPVKYFLKDHAGPAAARNFGARKAQGQLLAFLDSDVVAEPGWLAAGLEMMRKNPRWFGCEGRTMPWQAGGELETPFTHVVQNLHGGRWLTCNLFVRRAPFLKLGGFDERFAWPVREDSEFAFRALEAGKVFGFTSRAVVRHPVARVSMRRYFRGAEEGKYEALIQRRHPLSYSRYFKWTDGRALPAYYLPAYAALPALAWRWQAAVACLGMAWLATVYAWCRRKRVNIFDLARLSLPALVVPFLRLFWVAWGHARYPKAP